MTKPKVWQSLVIKRIEEDKERRHKNIYLFTLSMTDEQEQRFNKVLKQAINDIGAEVIEPDDDEESDT